MKCKALTLKGEKCCRNAVLLGYCATHYTSTEEYKKRKKKIISSK